jgi:Protein of unknown function (DUF3102)
VDEIRTRVGSTKQQIFEIGRLLTQAKGIVGHGKFKKWIKKQKFDFSYQTANNFMNVYHYCLENPAIVLSIRASVLYKIASPKFPKDLRDHLFKYGNVLENISVEEAKDICQRFKDGEIGLDSPEIKALVKFRKKNAQARAYEDELTERFAYLEKLRKYVEKQTSEFTWPTFPGKNRTEMTEKQVTQLTDIIDNIKENVERLKPSDLKEVKRIRPRFVVPEK